MHSSNTVAILYNSGSYGTYLEWLLTTLTTEIEIKSPVTQVGNSHFFRGNIMLFTEYENYIVSTNYKPFVRLHPKVYSTDSLNENCTRVANTAKKTIYIYPELNSVLLNINNFYSKVWNDWWAVQFLEFMPKDKIYQNWPVNESIPINEIPVWIKREFLSYYLMPAWFDQVNWYHPDKWQHPDCLIVGIRDLLYNPKDTIMLIQQHCDLKLLKPIESILSIHKTMLNLQKFTDQDQLCSTIVDCTVKNMLFDWCGVEIPLPSQAWIQWKFREIGYEIQCHGLDTFPTNSLQLRELLYKPNE